MLVRPIIRSFVFLFFVLALTSCGGGGGGGNAGGGGTDMATPQGRLSAASEWNNNRTEEQEK